jgi:hypothetical protein
MVPVSTRLEEQIYGNFGRRTTDAVNYVKHHWPFFNRKQGAHPPSREQRPRPLPKGRCACWEMTPKPDVIRLRLDHLISLSRLLGLPRRRHTALSS